MEKYFSFKYHAGIVAGVFVALVILFWVYMICVVEPMERKHIALKVIAGLLYWTVLVAACIGVAYLMW